MMDHRERPKQMKTAEELAAMVHADLSQMDGCPSKGVSVTVYGTPWKSMLMFGVAAGPVKNKAELQNFCNIITERLQRLYEIPSSPANDARGRCPASHPGSRD
jgi:hypothetical protein